MGNQSEVFNDKVYISTTGKRRAVIQIHPYMGDAIGQQHIRNVN